MSGLFRLRRREQPRSPFRRLQLDRQGAVVYAIGDVHGCLDELLRLEDVILRDADRLPGRKILVTLGDYVDRGPYSAQVIEHLLVSPPGFERICLCGNHEEMMLRFLEDPPANLPWLKLGGDATLASYGVDARYLLQRGRGRANRFARTVRDAVPPEHVAFLRNLHSVVWDDSVAFVHAGVAPGVDLGLQSSRDLLWAREPFLSQGPRLRQVVVHGHTPVLRPYHGKGRVNVDTGVLATGRLTALRIIGNRGKFLDSSGWTGGAHREAE